MRTFLTCNLGPLLSKKLKLSHWRYSVRYQKKLKRRPCAGIRLIQGNSSCMQNDFVSKEFRKKIASKNIHLTSFITHRTLFRTYCRALKTSNRPKKGVMSGYSEIMVLDKNDTPGRCTVFKNPRTIFS